MPGFQLRDVITTSRGGIGIVSEFGKRPRMNEAVAARTDEDGGAHLGTAFLARRGNRSGYPQRYSHTCAVATAAAEMVCGPVISSTRGRFSFQAS